MVRYLKQLGDYQGNALLKCIAPGVSYLQLRYLALISTAVNAI
jgi:hypothetical protein